MITVSENISLKDRTTIQTGGEARYFICCTSEDHVKEGLKFARSKGIPVLVMGGGSNLLIADEGFRGVVLDMSIHDLVFDNDHSVTAGAGVSWDALVSEACRRGLSGIEAMSGIPGRVGATPVQNVGAYGQEVSDTISKVRALNRDTMEIREFTNQDCQFSYRHSKFKTREGAPWIILAVTFVLDAIHEPTVKYEELKKALFADQRWTTVSRVEKITMIRDHVLRIRSLKGMVLDPQDPDTRSLGSFFVNPIVDRPALDRVIQIATERNLMPQPVAHPVGDNLWKLSAAWLIDKAGIQKGQYLGKARVSTKHVLALTNPSVSATTAEILALAALVQRNVHAMFGIMLIREPVLVDNN
jgi:UDP-N-acetylmuramate dehydrogenase